MKLSQSKIKCTTQLKAIFSPNEDAKWYLDSEVWRWRRGGMYRCHVESVAFHIHDRRFFLAIERPRPTKRRAPVAKKSEQAREPEDAQAVKAC